LKGLIEYMSNVSNKSVCTVTINGHNLEEHLKQVHNRTKAEDYRYKPMLSKVGKPKSTDLF